MLLKASPVIADLVADEDDFSVRSVFVPSECAHPQDEDEWLRDMGSIMDINMDNEDELEMLQDLRSGYEDIQYARELELAEDSAAPAPEAEPVVETIEEEDTIEDEAPPKKRIRFSREQVAILQREYDRGASRLSNTDIAMKINMKPEGIGRKVFARRCQELDVCEREKSTKPGTAQERGWSRMTAEKGGGWRRGKTLSMVELYP